MKKTLYLIDIDGTICEDVPNEEADRFATAKPLDGALEKICELYKEGHRITFFTARTSEHAEVTENWLDRHGFPYESVCYNKPRINPGESYQWIDNHHVTGWWVPSGLSHNAS